MAVPDLLPSTRASSKERNNCDTFLYCYTLKLSTNTLQWLQYFTKIKKFIIDALKSNTFLLYTPFILFIYTFIGYFFRVYLRDVGLRCLSSIVHETYLRIDCKNLYITNGIKHFFPLVMHKFLVKIKITEFNEEVLCI